MKTPSILILFIVSLFIYSCEKDKDEMSENVMFLTGTVWESDSLLVNGIGGSYSGGPLEPFKGETKFNEDGTGTIGTYTGTWKFEQNETVLVITTPSLPFVISTQVVELTATSLKITTLFLNAANPAQPLNIRMTYKAK